MRKTLVKLTDCLTSQMVDVGCGIGGSSRYISRKFGCSAVGITLSPQQAKRANEITANPDGKVSFQVSQGELLRTGTEHCLVHRILHTCFQPEESSLDDAGTGPIGSRCP